MKGPLQMVALWGRQAPPHSITAILITDDQRTIVTGSHEGQLCLWSLLPGLQVSSRQMLLGHTASVTCLAKARDFEKQPYVVSATENGEMSIWDTSSGRCVESARLPFRHTAICHYHSSFRMAGEGWLVCCGQYNDILIIDAVTLVVLHTLTSSSSSDWISCMCLVHSLRIQEDSLLAVSAAGDLKVWDLSSSVGRIQEKQNVFERERQPLDGTLCRAIRFCTYTERLLLVVFSTCWKVYDYCDFCLLCTEFSPSSPILAGGEILAAHRLIIWTEDGHGYIYQLVNSGLSRSVQPPKGGVLKETVRPVLLSSTEVEGDKSFSYTMGFMNERKEPFHKILYSGQASGRITLWHVPDVPVSTLDGSPKVIPVAASRTLQDNFNLHRRQIAEGLPDHPWRAPVAVSTYIPSLEKLVCGCENGSIIIVPALHAAKARLLGEGSLQKDPASAFRVLSDAGGSSVTALLVLPGRPVPCWLLSGSRDSHVVCWDLHSGEALHRFILDAGPVAHLLLSPDGCRRQGQRLVCCLCGDHSVALLHVQGRVCLLRARKHLFPVTALRWRPEEDLLVVGCKNDSVSVWDIDTGSLERYESGETARAILASCEDPGLTADPLYAALEGDSREKGPGGPRSSSSAFGSFSCHRQRGSFCHQGPFAVWPLMTTWESLSVSVLLFDLERLVELLCAPQASGLKSSNSLSTLDTLKRARSATEKRTSVLKRNRTSGSLCPVDGPARVASEGQGPGGVRAGGAQEQRDGIGRRKKAKSSKKMRRQSSGRTSLTTAAAEAARLLLSCFFPWGVNRELDGLCVQHLGILRLCSPVSFGLLSKHSYLTLMLPGWSTASSERVGKQQELVNLFSRKVLPLYSKYYSVTQEQAGKRNGWRNAAAFTEQRLALAYLLSRMSLVQRIMNMPSEKASLTKAASLRSKWRPAASLVLDDLNLEPAPHMSKFPVCESDNRSFVKLISCWRDQSVEVMEATQATLLAEVEQSMQQKTLAGGCGQTNSTGQGSRGAKSPPLLDMAFGTRGMTKCESCMATPSAEDGEGSAEEPGSPVC